MNIDEKELEKAYDLFYDYMIKCYGYCSMSYYDFKKCIRKMGVKKDENSTN